MPDKLTKNNIMFNGMSMGDLNHEQQFYGRIVEKLLHLIVFFTVNDFFSLLSPISGGEYS